MKRTSFLLALALGVGACGGDDDDGMTAQPILIGSLAPFTGAAPDLGTIAERAALYAVDTINKGGGVNGRMIELVFEDTAYDATVAAEAAQSLVDQGVVAVIGPVAGLEVPSVLAVTVPAGIPMISGTAAGAWLGPQNMGLAFRTTPSNTLLNAWGGTQIRGGSMDTLGVFTPDNAITLAHAAALEAGFKGDTCGASECTTVKVEYPTAATADTHDFAADVATVLAGSPDAVYLLGGLADNTAILEALDTAGYDGPLYVFIGFAAAVQDPSVFPADWRPRIRWANFTPVTGPDAQAYATGYEALHGRAPAGILQEFTLYDAVMMVALAAAAADANGGILAEQLPLVTNAPGAAMGPYDFATAMEMLAGGEEVDYTGFAGLEVSADGDTGAAPISWFQWNAEGKAQLVE